MRLSLLLWALLFCWTNLASGTNRIAGPPYEQYFFEQNFEFPYPSDTTLRKPNRTQKASSVYQAYNSYTLNSDSLLKGRVSQSFAWVDSFRNLQNQFTKKPLLWSPKALIKSMPESELTNLLADILLIESRSIWDTVHISLLNPGGIRAEFPADTLRLLHVMEVLPFPNHLDKITLSGTELQQLLDHWAGKGGIALSGMRMSIIEGKAADVWVGDDPLQQKHSYHVALPDYLVDGGDGCSFLIGSRVQRGAHRITDLVARHLETMGKSGELLKSQTDGRIRIR